MQRQPDSAVAHFTRARDTYESWISTLKADEGAATSRNDLTMATRITEQIQALNREAFNVQLRVCYCSVLEDCWLLDTRKPEPEPVQACPATPEGSGWES